MAENRARRHFQNNMNMKNNTLLLFSKSGEIHVLNLLSVCVKPHSEIVLM